MTSVEYDADGTQRVSSTSIQDELEEQARRRQYAREHPDPKPSLLKRVRYRLTDRWPDGSRKSY